MATWGQINVANIKLYGRRISYYTGKMGAYLSYKEIDHDFMTLNPSLMKRLKQETGAAQMPAVELADGRMMTDTTPMIAWLESEYPEHPITPPNHAMHFVSLLIEDYAEEWLWRPAMHYRWSYTKDRLHLGRKIVDELMSDVPTPAFVKRAIIRRRQHVEYVKKDGVDSNTWDHVESIYLNTLTHLEAIFGQRTFLLGDKPSAADFGYFASMFRHFAQDPTASGIMRLNAPSVFEWQARLWNARASQTQGSFLEDLPEDMNPIFADISTGYLPYLNDNARAWQQGLSHFDPVIQGVQYRQIPVSQYRVWCLEQLQAHALHLNSKSSELESLLREKNCWQALFELDQPESRYDEASEVPFKGRKVHYHNRRD